MVAGASKEISFCTEAGGGVEGWGGVGALVPQQAMWHEPLPGIPQDFWHAAVTAAGADAKSAHTSNTADKMAVNLFTKNYFLLTSASAAWIFLM